MTPTDEFLIFPKQVEMDLMEKRGDDRHYCCINNSRERKNELVNQDEVDVS